MTYHLPPEYCEYCGANVVLHSHAPKCKLSTSLKSSGTGKLEVTL